MPLLPPFVLLRPATSLAIMLIALLVGSPRPIVVPSLLETLTALDIDLSLLLEFLKVPKLPPNHTVSVLSSER